MEIYKNIVEFLAPYTKELWVIFTGFLVLGSNWYWNNRKTKAQAKQEVINNENLEIDNESKQIANMKAIMEIFQQNFKNELIEKNDTIEKLTVIINELKTKIDILSEDIKDLNNRMDGRDDEILNIAKKCTGKRKVGDVCVVLEHLLQNKK